MIKTNKIYKILTFVFGLALAGVIFASGLTALQKSLTLNLKVNINPTFEFKIDYAGNTIFCNTDKEGSGGPLVASGYTLNGDTLSFAESFEGIGKTFTLTIYNFSEKKVQISIVGNQASGEPLKLAPYISASDIPHEEMEITSVGTFALQIEENNSLSVVFDANGGSGGKSLDVQPNASYELPTKPTRDGYFFAGWATTKNATEAEWMSGVKICENDTTWYAVWQKYYTLTATFSFADTVSEYCRYFVFATNDPSFSYYSGHQAASGLKPTSLIFENSDLVPNDTSYDGGGFYNYNAATSLINTLLPNSPYTYIEPCYANNNFTLPSSASTISVAIPQGFKVLIAPIFYTHEYTFGPLDSFTLSTSQTLQPCNVGTGIIKDYSSCFYMPSESVTCSVVIDIKY